MSFTELQNGSQIAREVPLRGGACAPVHVDIQSLADLLAHMITQPTSHSPMLRTTAGKIAAFLGKAVEDITLDSIHANREGFRPYLEGHRYKEASIRSYVNYLRMLLEMAKGLGWRPFARVSSQWGRVFEAAKANKCVPIMKYLAEIKPNPEDVTADIADQWIQIKIARGIRYNSARKQVSAAWRSLVSCGYVKNAPVGYLRKKHYGVPLTQLPRTLQAEVAELIRWKTCEYEPDRPREAKVREVTAGSIQGAICAVYGYATQVAKFTIIDSLSKLLTKPVVDSYIAWCLNQQKVKGGALVPRLGAVLSAVEKHPTHKLLDLSWFRPLLAAVPTESYEEVKERKAKKYLSYEVLEGIPAKIRADLRSESKFGEEHVARLAMDALIIGWLLVLPWRQRNLRECRVFGANPNVFKATVSAFSCIELPGWARQAELENSSTEFWQIKFSPEETKTGVAVHSLLPLQLVTPLEEYLRDYRPRLLNGRSCDTLFVAPESETIDDTFFTNEVSNVTLRYGGRRVTPHIFRDVVAYAWLKAHRSDYLTLSKMLWHKNVSTTINYYGTRYNDSSATVAMEEWLEQRASGVKK